MQVQIAEPLEKGEIDKGGRKWIRPKQLKKEEKKGKKKEIKKKGKRRKEKWFNQIKNLVGKARVLTQFPS